MFKTSLNWNTMSIFCIIKIVPNHQSSFFHILKTLQFKHSCSFKSHLFFRIKTGKHMRQWKQVGIGNTENRIIGLSFASSKSGGGIVWLFWYQFLLKWEELEYVALLKVLRLWDDYVSSKIRMLKQGYICIHEYVSSDEGALQSSWLVA